MKVSRRKRNTVFLILLLIAVLGSSVTAYAKEEKESARVLFISSYSYAWDTVQIQIQGIQDGLEPGVVLDYEFMDTKRVSDEKAMKLFYDGLKYRMSQVEPYDVVILGDDAALSFALEKKDVLFKDIPLVFEGVNNEWLARNASKDPMITGIIEKLSIEKNIDFGLSYNPTAAKVVALLDDSVTGQAERERFYQVAEKYPSLKFEEINASAYATSLLKKAISKVDKDSILIYIVMTEDASGKQYTNQESVQLIAQNAKVPAIRMVEGGIGEGLLGGNIVSMHASGKIAAQLAMKIINGTPCEEIDMIGESPNVFCLDEAVMKKFGISEELVPEGTVLMNHQESFFKRNKEVLVPGGMLVFCLLLIVGWALLDNWRRRKLMQELEEARSIMENASQHDFLTGLPNRSKFMADLQRMIDSERACTLMMLDIDDFKKINDTYGHTAGDIALQQVADRLKEMQTQLLSAYRYAGDEFILILESKQRKIVEKTAFQCRHIFGKMYNLDGVKHQICGSIGIACYPQDAQTLEELIVCADEAMYQVKKNGKNDYAFYRTPDWENNR